MAIVGFVMLALVVPSALLGMRLAFVVGALSLYCITAVDTSVSTGLVDMAIIAVVVGAGTWISSRRRAPIPPAHAVSK